MGASPSPDPRARTEGALMLVLALTSYRGFFDFRPGATLRATITDALSLPPLENDWRLAWGPATNT
jgi:hypothetical protein